MCAWAHAANLSVMGLVTHHLAILGEGTTEQYKCRETIIMLSKAEIIPDHEPTKCSLCMLLSSHISWDPDFTNTKTHITSKG